MAEPLDVIENAVRELERHGVHMDAEGQLGAIRHAVKLLRASTPEGSERPLLRGDDMIGPGVQKAIREGRVTTTPPSHDVEALREALEEIGKREHADTCQYVLTESPEYECNCHVAIARRTLSTHVGDEG